MRFGLGFSLLSVGYLLLVLLLIAIGVDWKRDPATLSWGHWLGSLAYLGGTVHIGLKTMRKKHIALLVAFLAAPVWWFLVLVIGMNFHFLMGGSI